MKLPLNQGWQFRRIGRHEADWISVDLPHTPFIADLDGQNHWFGECEYQRDLRPPPLAHGSRCMLHVGAAMHTCRVFAGAREIARHEGGYLPYETDLTDHLDARGCCRLTLRLDNRDNPDIPPGKPYADLDFCWYGGLYRQVELHIRSSIHITDAVSAGEVSGGGVFLQTLMANERHAEVAVRTHVRNTSAAARVIRVRVEFRRENRTVIIATSEPLVLGAGATQHTETTLPFLRPALWSPASPALYDVVVSVVDEYGVALDCVRTRFGIRRIAFSRSGGFVINGSRLRLRGTNRHQELPRVGYAAPRAAQYRDARRIKEAGFDYVRLSHYPQAPEFLDACDELGIVVMTCIPGWQFLGGERFRAAVCEDARRLIRRDRNHACVVLWELSLNETMMDEELMARLHAIGHEEYPGDQMFTCGWLDRYDVFTHSRQHGEIHRWRNGDKALVVAEYGDWEFFASNHGFDQKTGAGVFASWSHARQRRAHGERGLRQQTWNHVIALNDTLSSPAVLDGQWSMFDYARGYDPERAACGVMDMFRLPKFSYFFYRSQRHATEDGGAAWTGGPVVFIASHWTARSDLRVLVFSNCDEVELRYDGVPIERKRPEKTWMTQYLPHPPFAFDLPAFAPGALEAVGFVDGRAVASHRVATPGSPIRLELEIDTAGVAPAEGEPDVLIAHARLLDAHGTVCIGDTSDVVFACDESASLLGPANIAAEAGIASVVVRVPANTDSFTLTARVIAQRSADVVTCHWQRQSDRVTIPPTQPELCSQK